MAIVNLRVLRTQWAVGNGFFHSGHIASKRSTIDYVYDCGALSPRVNQDALSREIAELARRIETVHFMFISHFDFDHVSGIAELASVVRIRKFVIPLVPPAERLLLFVRNLVDDPSDGGPRAEGFYPDFIVSPEGALRSLDPNGSAPAEIEIVPPGQSAAPAEAEDAELLPPRDLKGADDSAILTVAKQGPHRVEARVGLSAVWEWFPYVAEQARDITSYFVDALLARKVIANEIDLAKSKILKDIVLNKQEILIAAYDDAVHKAGSSFTRNLTSLLLYSGPTLKRRYRAYRTAPSPIERAEHGAWDPKPGWLGLGDADLRAKKRIDEVNRVFLAYKPLVGTFAPSHHGSKLDWSKELLDGFVQSGRSVPTFVFGASGAYRSRKDNAVLHPDGDVILDINEFGGTSIVVGLSEASRWTEAQRVYFEI